MEPIGNKSIRASKQFSSKGKQMTSLRYYLFSVDKMLEETGRENVPPEERIALKLGRQVTPEPFSEHNIEWLSGEATEQACRIKIMQAAWTTTVIFTFKDRSVLVLQDTGEFFGVPVASEYNVSKIETWLRARGFSC